MNYSLENARKFNWSSISGELNSARVSYLETYLVGEKILDAGCGGGAYVEFLAHKGLDVTGIDKHEEFLQVAREQGRIGTYIQGDLTHLPFPDKTFDCTYCFDVLEHIDDKVAIQELARVTKNRLIFTVPQKDEVMQKFGLLLYPYQDPTHLRYYTEDSVRELAAITNPLKVDVILEGLIPLHILFKEVLKDNELKIPSWLLRYSYRAKPSDNLLGKLLNKASDIISHFILNVGSLNQVINNYLDSPNHYKIINLGLAVIIDLESKNLLV